MTVHLLKMAVALLLSVVMFGGGPAFARVESDAVRADPPEVTALVPGDVPVQVASVRDRSRFFPFFPFFLDDLDEEFFFEEFEEEEDEERFDEFFEDRRFFFDVDDEEDDD